MRPKADLEAESKVLAGVISDARKRAHSFAMLISKDGLVFEADKKKSVEMMRKAAKAAGGGGRGAWGVLTVNSKTLLLDCEAEPPGNLGQLAKKHFAERGQSVKVEIRLQGDNAQASDPEPGPEPNPPTSVQDDYDAPDPDDPDDEDDLAAARGDVKALINAARKRPYNFACLLADGEPVLKTHRRRPAALLTKLAKSEGGSPRGGWGKLTIEGKRVVLLCEEDPPQSLARALKLYLKARGAMFGVKVVSPFGEVIEPEDDEAPAEAPTPIDYVVEPDTEAPVAPMLDYDPLLREIAARVPDLDTGPAKKLQVLATMLEQSVAAGDVDKSAKTARFIKSLLGPDLEAAPAPLDAASGGGRRGKPTKKTTTQTDAAPEGAPESGGLRGYPRAVKVTKEMDNLEFSNLVDMQIFGLTRAEAEADNKDPANRVQPLDTVVTAEEVARGSVIVVIIDSSLPAMSEEEIAEADAAIADMSPEEIAAMNDHADAVFWEKTGYKPGELLDPNDPNFDEMAAAWKKFRADSVQMKQKFDALPPRLREFFQWKSGGVELTPEKFEKVLKIAEKLSPLSNEALAEYWKRTTARTTDIDVFAASVDRYIASVETRGAVHEARVDAQNDIVGRGLLYDSFVLAHSPMRGKKVPPNKIVYAPGDKEHNAKISAAIAALPGLLEEWDYEDEAAFMAHVKQFREAFQAEAITVANESMDRREHDLFAFEEEVLTAKKVNGMMTALEGIRDSSDDPEVLRQQLEEAIASNSELQKLIALRRSEEPDYTLDEEMIELLSESDSPKELDYRIRKMLDERREAMTETRQRLADDPGLIWDFDKAIAQTKAEAGIDSGTFPGVFLDDYVEGRKEVQMGRSLVLGGLSIVAGLLSGGAGSVVVRGIALTGGTVLSGYDAWDAYDRFVTEENAKKAGVSSTDPSFVWVVVALMGLGLDALGMATALDNVKPAAHVAKIVESGTDVNKAVKAFNAAQAGIETTQDAEAAVKKLANDLLKVDDNNVREAILKAAKAEAEANAAWNAAKIRYKGNKGLYSLIDPLQDVLNWAIHFVYPVCLRLKDGFRQLDKFLKTRRAIDMIGNFDELSVEAQKNVMKAYKNAVTEWEKIAKRTVELGLDKRQLDDAFEIWGLKPDMTSDKFISDILEPMAKLPLIDDLPRSASAADELIAKASPRPLNEKLTAEEAKLAKVANSEISELRESIKNADLSALPAEQVDELRALKKKLDEHLRDTLARQGHGPQRHDGDVTLEQLEERSLKGISPETGKKTNPNGKKHKVGRHSTRIKDPGDYVDAERYVRSSKSFLSESIDPTVISDKFLKVDDLTLRDVFGPNYLEKMEGISRVGKLDDPASYGVPTDLKDGKLIALFNMDAEGDWQLVTMYPDPHPSFKPK